jgi:hypothetical protein
MTKKQKQSKPPATPAKGGVTPNADPGENRKSAPSIPTAAPKK